MRVTSTTRSPGVRDAVAHAWLTLRRTPGRAAAFGLAAFLASGLLAVGVTDAASRQSEVGDTFDALAARRVQVTTPVRGGPYRDLTREHLRAIAAIPGATGVAWASWDHVVLGTEDGVEASRLWTVDGDLAVLGLRTEGRSGFRPSRGLLAGGAGPLAATPRFGHAVVDGRSIVVAGTVTSSPVLGDVLDTAAVVGTGTAPSLAAPGELVVGVRPGWAAHVAPRLAAVLAPGRESSVLVRYPPEADRLRSGVLGSVDSLVYVTSAAILALGAGAVAVGTYLRVVAERRLLGLYRAIGGSARFVVSTLVVEAAVVGVLGSTLGTVVGLGVASGRTLATERVLHVPWLVVAAGLLVGLATNAVGALVPAVVMTRQSPLAAIRSR